MWAVGIALQVVFAVAPAALARRVARHDNSRMLQQLAAHDERVDASDYADSLSRVAQRTAARASGEFRIDRNGDTVFAIVSTPSGRADAPSDDALRRSVERSVRIMLGIQFGAVPVALIGLTLAWVLVRRRRETWEAAHRVA